MVAITRLEPSDAIDVDRSVVTALFRAQGAAIAEELVMAHVVDLTERLAVLDRTAQPAGDIRDSDSLRHLAGLAGEIGLTSLAHSLMIAAQAAQTGNSAALPVLWDRVKRVGDRSLAMLWDMPQLRM